jgi:L-iditol 2-dehydrogenase
MFAHPVPDEISDDAASLLEPLSVGLWAGHLGEVGPDSRVLVTGAGTIGLMAVIGALACGATDITVAARNRHRLDVAGLLGAVTINGSDRQLPVYADADVLIECTGVPSARDAHSMPSFRVGAQSWPV